MVTDVRSSSSENASVPAIPPLEKSRTLIAVGMSEASEEALSYLKNLGYLIESVDSTKGLRDQIMAQIPNVLLIDIDQVGFEAIQLTRSLKENPLTYTMPIVIVLGQRDLSREIDALEAGAEDYVVKPFPPQVLAARIYTSMRRNIRLQVSNPLTGLPGATYIEEQTSKRLEAGLPTAMCYADLDHFKAFNDKYGYSRGDNVIRILATILHESISMFGRVGDFVGHVGGDDFVIITDYNCLEPVCEYVTTSFDTLIPFQYDEKDMEQGFILSYNRLGEERHFPFVTVSIGIVTNERRPLDNYLMMTELAAEMKEYTKSISKSAEISQSIFQVDKRTR